MCIGLNTSMPYASPSSHAPHHYFPLQSTPITSHTTIQTFITHESNCSGPGCPFRANIYVNNVPKMVRPTLDENGPWKTKKNIRPENLHSPRRESFKSKQSLDYYPRKLETTIRDTVLRPKSCKRGCTWETIISLLLKMTKVQKGKTYEIHLGVFEKERLAFLTANPNKKSRPGGTQS